MSNADADDTTADLVVAWVVICVNKASDSQIRCKRCMSAIRERPHSPFTEALLGHIEEPDLEIVLLFRKIRDAVLKRTGQAQEPFVYGSLPSEGLYFKKAAR